MKTEKLNLTKLIKDTIAAEGFAPSVVPGMMAILAPDLQARAKAAVTAVLTRAALGRAWEKARVEQTAAPVVAGPQARPAR